MCFLILILIRSVIKECIHDFSKRMRVILKKILEKGKGIPTLGTLPMNLPLQTTDTRYRYKFHMISVTSKL
jgi:hypothetical protein